MNFQNTFTAEKQSLDCYDPATLAFHWATTLIVLVLFGSALLWNHAPRQLHLHSFLEPVHVALGIVLAVIIVARLVWRITGGRRLQRPERGLARLLPQLMYVALYGLLVVQVTLGFSQVWLADRPVRFFGLFALPSPLTPNRFLGHSFEHLHNWIAWAMIILAAGHAAAALVHHYMVRDNVMQRMLPRRAGRSLL
jgi:cytochrome b561